MQPRDMVAFKTHFGEEGTQGLRAPAPFQDDGRAGQKEERPAVPDRYRHPLQRHAQPGRQPYRAGPAPRFRLREHRPAADHGRRPDRRRGTRRRHPRPHLPESQARVADRQGPVPGRGLPFYRPHGLRLRRGPEEHGHGLRQPPRQAGPALDRQAVGEEEKMHRLRRLRSMVPDPGHHHEGRGRPRSTSRLHRLRRMPHRLPLRRHRLQLVGDLRAAAAQDRRARLGRRRQPRATRPFISIS